VVALLRVRFVPAEGALGVVAVAVEDAAEARQAVQWRAPIPQVPQKRGGCERANMNETGYVLGMPRSRRGDGGATFEPTYLGFPATRRVSKGQCGCCSQSGFSAACVLDKGGRLLCGRSCETCRLVQEAWVKTRDPRLEPALVTDSKRKLARPVEARA
jgi:hypothetical protein